MSAPPVGEASGFISVRLAHPGSGHTICCEKKSSLPGEGTHLDLASKRAFEHLHFLYLERRILVASSEAEHSLP